VEEEEDEFKGNFMAILTKIWKKRESLQKMISVIINMYIVKINEIDKMLISKLKWNNFMIHERILSEINLQS